MAELPPGFHPETTKRADEWLRDNIGKFDDVEAIGYASVGISKSLETLLRDAEAAARREALDEAERAARGNDTDHTGCDHPSGYRDGRIDAAAAVHALIEQPPVVSDDGWVPIDDAPFGVWGWVWHRALRRAFPGMRNGDNGAVWIDTCETEARGRQDHATHWRPATIPIEQPPGGPERTRGGDG